MTVTKTRRILIAGAAVLSASVFLPATADASMTAHIWMNANGERIEGESTVTTLDRENTIETLRFNFEVLTDSNRQRLYKPLVWVQRWDKSVVRLWQALTENAVVEAKIRFYRPDTQTGFTEHFFTVEVSGARISRIRAVNPDALGAPLDPPLMEIELVFTNIIMTYEPTGAAHQDNLQDP